MFATCAALLLSVNPAERSRDAFADVRDAGVDKVNAFMQHYYLEAAVVFLCPAYLFNYVVL